MRAKTPAGAARCCGLHGNIGNLHGTAVDASGYLHGRLYGDDLQAPRPLRLAFAAVGRRRGACADLGRRRRGLHGVGVYTVSVLHGVGISTVEAMGFTRWLPPRQVPSRSLSPQPHPEQRGAGARLTRPICRGVGETPILEQPWRLGGTRLRPPRTRRHRVSPSLSELRLGDSESVSPREAPPLGPRHSEPGRRAAGPSHHAESDVLASSRRTLKRTGPVQIS